MRRVRIALRCSPPKTHPPPPLKRKEKGKSEGKKVPPRYLSSPLLSLQPRDESSGSGAVSDPDPSFRDEVLGLRSAEMGFPFTGKKERKNWGQSSRRRRRTSFRHARRKLGGTGVARVGGVGVGVDGWGVRSEGNLLHGVQSH